MLEYERAHPHAPGNALRCSCLRAPGPWTCIFPCLVLTNPPFSFPLFLPLNIPYCPYIPQQLHPPGLVGAGGTDHLPSLHVRFVCQKRGRAQAYKGAGVCVSARLTSASLPGLAGLPVLATPGDKSIFAPVSVRCVSPSTHANVMPAEERPFTISVLCL